jgi:hypothetical protein
VQNLGELGFIEVASFDFFSVNSLKEELFAETAVSNAISSMFLLPLIPVPVQFAQLPVAPLLRPTSIFPQALPAQEALPLQQELPAQKIIQAQEVRVLPGALDEVPVFNSNSPEIVTTEGILLSTFPPTGKRIPSAHLNFVFNGRFDIFSHHISKAGRSDQTRSLFQGILLYNPTSRPVQIEVLQAATYLTRPDALFVDLPAYVEDPLGNVFAGPGSRVANDILRGRKQGSLPSSILLPAGQTQLLMSLPIPAGTVPPTSNGRSTLMRLSSNGAVHVATLAMFAPLNLDKTERIPTLEEWQTLLNNGALAGLRDLPPTLNVKRRSCGFLPCLDRITYGRVSGVARGSLWQAKLIDSPSKGYLSIPQQGRAFSYGLSTVEQGTFGTGQIQSAPMLVRYPDTAYLANGNYGVQYSLTLPLRNTTQQNQRVAIAFETPIKQDKAKNQLLFLSVPESRISFRGTVRLRYMDDGAAPQTRYIHLVQRRGQQGEPLVTLMMKPSEQRSVEVDFLYPPDATPPQVLTVKTLDILNSQTKK